MYIYGIDIYIGRTVWPLRDYSWRRRNSWQS